MSRRLELLFAMTCYALHYLRSRYVHTRIVKFQETIKNEMA